MAIGQVAVYAHLNEADVEALGRELDTIRANIEESLGSKDAAYIRRTITFQRTLDVAARLVIGCSRARKGWLLGTIALAVAKSIENMEIGHNVGHGQWDWMNDPEIHSSTWEWDMPGLSSQWRYSHNYTHHIYTNVIGMDDDMGFGIMRITRDESTAGARCLNRADGYVASASIDGSSDGLTEATATWPDAKTTVA